ncbi:hypothetical protein BH11PSE4_BH11PSE4_16730 [soil metagenome]
MGADLDPLILDLLEWISREPRSYADVLEAWRTSCPRLTVWEDCVDRGYAARQPVVGRETMVALTQAGHAFLGVHRPWSVHPDQTGAADASVDARQAVI